MSTDDLTEVADLLDVVAGADGRRPLSDHLYLDLVGGGGEGFAGMLAYDSGLDQLVAYAQISRGNDAHILELAVHPQHRDELESVGADLITVALDVVGTEGGGEVNWWVHEPTSVHTTLAEGARMLQTRTLLQMRRPLPAERHASIETRPFTPGTDDLDWLRVNNRAFADHAEQGGWTTETFVQRQQEPWFDADGFRLHERDGRLAGFCWTKVHHAVGPDEPHDGDLGEIYVIAVDPDFRSLGLGSEMTLAGLDHLAERGIPNALLYVDAANEAAVTMYRRLGFGVHASNAAFTVEVDAFPDRSTEELGANR